MDHLETAKKRVDAAEEQYDIYQVERAQAAAQMAIAHALIAAVERLDSLSVPLDIDRVRNALLVADADKE